MCVCVCVVCCVYEGVRVCVCCVCVREGVRVCVRVCVCESVWLVEKFLVSSWGGVRYRAGTSKSRPYDYKCINTLYMYMYMHKVHVPSLVHCLGQR